MGKLAVLMAMKKDLASDYERELRAVRNLILGTTRLSGSEYTVDLDASEGRVAASRARAAFIEAVQAALQEPLLKYAHDLAHESLAHGLDQKLIGSALAGLPAGSPPLQTAEDPARGAPIQSVVRLAVCN